MLLLLLLLLLLSLFEHDSSAVGPVSPSEAACATGPWLQTLFKNAVWCSRR
jgi:hypothetical protein